jgi:hypothetical protein
MPRPPAEPARAARDGRRHAACRVTSAEPLVGRGKRRAACPLARGGVLRVNLLAVGRTGRGTSSLRPLGQPSARGEIPRVGVRAAQRQQKHKPAAEASARSARRAHVVSQAPPVLCTSIAQCSCGGACQDAVVTGFGSRSAPALHPSTRNHRERILRTRKT